MLKKLFFAILVSFIFLIQSATTVVHAQGPWYDPTFDQWYAKVFDESDPNEIFGERYTYAQVKWIILSLQSLGVNLIPLSEDPEKDQSIKHCIVTGNASDCISEINLPTDATAEPTSLLQKGQQFIAFMGQERPISLISYVRNMGNKLNPIKEANAQQPGFGYSALSSVQPIWQMALNLTYVFFVFVFIITSFMIMFRVKISPQTVISVQSALPRIFIALILATFSYAIAGFLVDLMYVVIGLVGLSLNINLGSLNQSMFEVLTQGIQFIGLSGILSFIALYLVFLVLATANIMFGSTLGMGILGAIIFIVAVVAALFVGFKIFWALLKATAYILLMTIAAPLQIALGVVQPQAGFSSWIKNFIANLAVFPVTGILFMLAYMFAVFSFTDLPAGSVAGTTQGATLFTAPGWPPLLNIGGEWGRIIMLGVSFVIYASIPKAAELIKSLVSGKPFAFGQAISEAYGPALGMGRTTGLQGAATVVTRSEDAAARLGKSAPPWTQVTRRVLGLKK